MNIILDYDGTYTADPVLWDAVIALFTASGHTIICCTMRYEDEGAEVLEALSHQVSQIVFTGRINKSTFLYAKGIPADIWIDDQPHWIFKDAAQRYEVI